MVDTACFKTYTRVSKITKKPIFPRTTELIATLGQAYRTTRNNLKVSVGQIQHSTLSESIVLYRCRLYREVVDSELHETELFPKFTHGGDIPR